MKLEQCFPLRSAQIDQKKNEGISLIERKCLSFCWSSNYIGLYIYYT